MLRRYSGGLTVAADCAKLEEQRRKGEVMTRNWLTTCIIGAAMGFAVMETGCTADLWQDVTFTEPGLYECRARAPGYEDLPVFMINTETAEPLYRQGFGASSTITMTTIDGKRIVFADDSPQNYYCVKVEDA